MKVSVRLLGLKRSPHHVLGGVVAEHDEVTRWQGSREHE
jgi:hypothetical protein